MTRYILSSYPVVQMILYCCVFVVMMDITSISKSELVLKVGGRHDIPVILKRHLAPKTVGVILRSLPLDGNTHFIGKSIVYFESGLNAGIESQHAKSDFKKGDVAFYPVGGSICFFKTDASIGKKMSPIGKIGLDGIDNLCQIRSGDVLSLTTITA